jgi:ABC-type proline/glycine betaine transport system permease subunit
MHTLRRGLLAGIFASLVLANITNHAPSLFSLSFGQFLATFPLVALFGMLLGAIFIQWQGRHGSLQLS